MKSTTSVATTIEDVETHDDPNYRPTLDTISAASSLAAELSIVALPSYIGQRTPRERSPVPCKNAKPESLAPPKTRRKIRMLQRELKIPEGQCAVTLEHTPKSSFEYAHVIPRSIALTEACVFFSTVPLTDGHYHRNSDSSPREGIWYGPCDFEYSHTSKRISLYALLLYTFYASQYYS